MQATASAHHCRDIKPHTPRTGLARTATARDLLPPHTTQQQPTGAHLQEEPTSKRAGYSQPRSPQPAGWRIGWPRPTYLALQRCVPYAEYGAHLALALSHLSAMRQPAIHSLLVAVAPLLRFVRRTPGISCEAVRAAAKRRNAQGGTSARRTGAALSFVSFIPLFDGPFFRQFVGHFGVLASISRLGAPRAATGQAPARSRRLPHHTAENRPSSEDAPVGRDRRTRSCQSHRWRPSLGPMATSST